MCSACGTRTSVTAGTIFDRTRTPMTVWFAACWMFAIQKDGISAMSLQRALGISSYQTAWAMLHRLRSVLVRPGRELLAGRVEVDETLIGGTAEGDRGGRTPGEKALVAIGIELYEPKVFGRCRMSVIDNASAGSLREFLVENVEEGSTVVTDGWPSYRPATKGKYTHQRNVAPGRQAVELLPAVHRVASLTKRWLVGTHQGSVDDAHLSLYLDEFVFRFNRRHSRSRGLVFFRLMQLAVGHDPVRYRQLILNPTPKDKPPKPPATRGQPKSLEMPPAGRPWRADGETTQSVGQVE